MQPVHQPYPPPSPLQVKSDEHMQKVKEQLLYEKQQIEASDMRCAGMGVGVQPGWS